MMSSCRSGSVISCTACLSGWSPITTTNPTSASRATPRRTLRRRARAARRADALGRRWVAAGLATVGGILNQLRKYLGQLGLQLLNRAVVADDEVRFLGLFVLGQLPCRAR